MHTTKHRSPIDTNNKTWAHRCMNFDGLADGGENVCSSIRHIHAVYYHQGNVLLVGRIYIYSVVYLRRERCRFEPFDISADSEIELHNRRKLSCTEAKGRGGLVAPPPHFRRRTCPIGDFGSGLRVTASRPRSGAEIHEICITCRKSRVKTQVSFKMWVSFIVAEKQNGIMHSDKISSAWVGCGPENNRRSLPDRPPT